MKNNFAATETTTTADLHASNVIYVVKVAFFTVIALLIFVLKGSCSDSTRINAKNAVYIQVAGVGNAHAINVERIIGQGAKMNYTVSVGYSPAKSSVSVPVAISAFTTGKKHHFDMSLALIPHVEKHTYSKTKEDLDKQLYIKPAVGYRYQKMNSGLFVKIGVGPQIFMDPPSSNIWKFNPKLVAPSAQLALGVSF